MSAPALPQTHAPTPEDRIKIAFQNGVWTVKPPHLVDNVWLIGPEDLTPFDLSLSGPMPCQITLAPGADALLFEHALSTDTKLDLTLAKDARLSHSFVTPASGGSSAVSITLQAAATYEQLCQTHGDQGTDRTVTATLAGRNAHFALLAAIKTEGKGTPRLVANITHAAPNCTSKQLIRSVVDGSAKASFHGKITVDRAAQKTDAAQKSDTLLLSDTAIMDTKPELEIYADDVKCSHGATVGALDDTALFYLQSRGIPAQTAQKLLTDAFLAEVFTAIETPKLRAIWEGKIQ
jgi:Fe-S cluster assembly protein SufD